MPTENSQAHNLRTTYAVGHEGYDSIGADNEFGVIESGQKGGAGSVISHQQGGESDGYTVYKAVVSDARESDGIPTDGGGAPNVYENQTGDDGEIPAQSKEPKGFPANPREGL